MAKPTFEALFVRAQNAKWSQRNANIMDQIMFLQEDRKDEAEIRATQASSMRQLVEAGFEPSTVTKFIATGDTTVLQHTGVFSVQLQAPTDGETNAL
jgi:hypothetical protein